MTKPLIALQSELGLSDGRSADMAGNILKFAPRAEIYPVQHCFTPGDIMGAGGMIYSVLPFFPKGTVYISTVGAKGAEEPTAICPLAVETKCGRFIVAPDNGTLTAWLNAFGAKTAVRLSTAVGGASGHSFDGSAAADNVDIYAYYGARLAMGEAVLTLGEELDIADISVIALRPPTVERGRAECGLFSILRNFGNLNLNITIEEFAQTGFEFKDMADITLLWGEDILFHQRVPYQPSFGYVGIGEAVLFNGSSGYMGLGLNQASFAAAYMAKGLLPGADLAKYTLVIERKG